MDASACLKAHNDKRALHENTPALVWDDTLAKGAKEWADHLMDIMELEHSTSGERNGAGENLFSSAGGIAATCIDAVEDWCVSTISIAFTFDKIFFNIF